MIHTDYDIEIAHRAQLLMGSIIRPNTVAAIRQEIAKDEQKVFVVTYQVVVGITAYPARFVGVYSTKRRATAAIKKDGKYKFYYSIREVGVDI